ncbi:MAG: helicase C-terminal domain-containing protein [Opitutales bacterium]
MQLQAGERQVTLSVREFAGFVLGPVDRRGGYAPWRAQAGTLWHQTLRDAVETTEPTARFEVPLEGVVQRAGWRFRLQGRVDQWLAEADGRQRLREVKTVQRSLPEEPDTLRADYPEYWLQAALYQVLAETLDPAGQYVVELVFVGLRDGFQQVIALEPGEAARLVDGQAQLLVGFLEERWRAQARRASLEVRPAYEALREGQAEALERLRQARADRQRVTFFEAPTGFGKTGLTWQWALEGLREGAIEHVIYATGKSTGQLEVTRQLGQMLPPESLRFFQMRGRAEQGVACPVAGCAGAGPHCREHIQRRWNESELHPLGVFGRDRTVSTEELRARARESGICPYEIARSLLAWADLWVGDFNYVFSPAHRGVFLEQPGFSARRTLLIVDEGHNLPERVAAACSGGFTAERAREAEDGLRAIGAPVGLRSPWGLWVEFLEGLDATDAHSPTVEMEFAAHLEALAEAVYQVPLDFLEVDPALLETLWELPSLRQFYENEALEKLLWSPRSGEIRLDCLDASTEIGKTLQSFGECLILSATLAPRDAMTAAVGLEAGTACWIEARAPWRETAYRVAVDVRVDTRYQQREKHFQTTAETVATFNADRGQPIAVFFPSYRYAESVRAHLEASQPGFRAIVQPRGFDLAAQQEWIYEALLLADALFLVLGGSFAEGVDLLGGRIERVMIVGPALPEVNALQNARLERRRIEGRSAAFRAVYQVPGIRKVNQALGRLVRAPGQHAAVLLHGQRFAESAYAELLGREYQEGTLVRDAAEFEQWLRAIND